MSSKPMSQSVIVNPAIFSEAETLERRHRRRLAAGWIAAIIFVAVFSIYGFNYYTLSANERPFSPKHALLRPSGAIGVNLGVFGVLLFFLIYLYPLRKKWSWLGRQGNSRHWLDFHIIMGTAAPLVIAFHSSFKFGGIAGMAFWIMFAVSVSGIIGRYLYREIPPNLKTAEMTQKEFQEFHQNLAGQFQAQKLGNEIEFGAFPRLP